MFFSGGIFRHAALSRASVILGAEAGLHFIPLCLGLLLIVNASIPPIPSFFPELLIVFTINSLRLQLFSFFAIMRVFVCYYNAYFFILISQIKMPIFSLRRHNLLELKIFFLLIAVSLVSLGFLVKL